MNTVKADETVGAVKSILGDALGIGERAAGYDASTPLLGSIPEFDSMAVVTVLTLIEERFDVDIADDEVDADVFATVGTLAAFVESKLAG